MTRQINAAGLKLIKQQEGLRLTTYLDVGGLSSVGYGHRTSLPVGTSITLDQANEWLRKDLISVEGAIEGRVNVKLTDNQFAALVSFAYNVGIGSFWTSILLAKLNQSEYDAVTSEFFKWIHVHGVISSGLLARRYAEAQLWIAKDAEIPKSATIAA